MAVAIAVHLSESCGKDAWLTVQGFNFQSCVVGKTVHTVVAVHIACFQKGVSLKCIGCFWDVVVTTHFFQPFDKNIFVVQNLAHFLELVLVIGGHYQ